MFKTRYSAGASYFGRNVHREGESHLKLVARGSAVEILLASYSHSPALSREHFGLYMEQRRTRVWRPLQRIIEGDFRKGGWVRRRRRVVGRVDGCRKFVDFKVVRSLNY